MGFVDGQDRGAATAFGLLGGPRVGDLRDDGGVVDQRLPAERGDVFRPPYITARMTRNAPTIIKGPNGNCDLRVARPEISSTAP